MSSVEAAPGGRSKVTVEVWADLGCPWCYLGRHRLAEAIARRSDRDRFTVQIRSFELNPGAPRTPETIEQAFLRAHGGSAASVLEAEGRMQALAMSEGLAYAVDRSNANTFDFHRVLHLAEASGHGLAFFSYVQDQFFAGDLDPFAPGALVEAGRAVGLDEAAVRDVLDSDAFGDAVRADVAEGAALGATGVPFVVVGRRVAAAGAQSVDGYAQLLDAGVDAVAAS